MLFRSRGSPENFVCFNPKIIHPSEKTITLEEGCLTFPGLTVKIKRPQHVRVRFTTPNGEIITKQFTGMTARIFQHELDHLNGITFNKRAKPMALKMGEKKRGKFNKLVDRFEKANKKIQSLTN